ncbi:MAG: DUF2656 domain-containing protein [Alkalinema sp. RU_4_3]|nr:DUF2656 domain-containing protein [Alkalinema sp. RU_4_3]
MLLSHNFNVTTDVLPELSRSQFTTIFKAGLNATCRELENSPHWIVEVLFEDSETPASMGEAIAKTLAAYRQATSGHSANVLTLGGLKTTPPTSNSPDALQPNQWGVDVVETADAEVFLTGLNWEATIATRPADSVFCAIA